MDAQIPFCGECGAVGTMLSGEHPGDGGVVHWTIYRCGHTMSEVIIEGNPAAEPDLLSAATAND